MKHKKVKGRMKVLKVYPYRDHLIYIRMIGKDYFEYLLFHDGQLYSSYIIILPEEGKKKLTKAQINGCIEIVSAGAEATINALMGVELSDEDKEKVALFEKHRKEVIKKRRIKNESGVPRMHKKRGESED